MKLRKVLSVGILAMLVLTTGSTPILATETNQKAVKSVALCDCGLDYGEHLNYALDYIEKNDKDGQITRRRRSLGCECGENMSVQTVYNGKWYRSDEPRKCEPYAYGLDYKWIKPAVNRYKCTKCQLEFEVHSTSRTEWRCENKQKK